MKLNKVLDIFSLKKIWIYTIIFAFVGGFVFAILLSGNKNIIKNGNDKIQNKDTTEIGKENKKTTKTKTEEKSEKESILENDNREENANTKMDEKITTKTIEKTESIPFNKTTENEVNMLRGTTKLIKNGVNGTKIIKYKVSYNSDNKEISREIISETITKQPINEVTKVGTSDYNLNSDVYGIFFGYICNSNELDDLEGCGYAEKMYCSITLHNIRYLKNIIPGSGNPNCYKNDSGKVNGNIIMNPGNPIGTVNYNGQTLYYDLRAGVDNVPLTEEICNKYDLSCGRW